MLYPMVAVAGKLVIINFNCFIGLIYRTHSDNQLLNVMQSDYTDQTLAIAN
jgi:hypothetical protein